jgi:hypothetical protein
MAPLIVIGATKIATCSDLKRNFRILRLKGLSHQFEFGQKLYGWKELEKNRWWFLDFSVMLPMCNQVE